MSLVAAKGGNANAVVVVGLLGDSELPDGICASFDGNDNSGPHPSTRLRQFTESFEFGFFGSVCVPSYVPLFSEAIATIETACEEFVPPG